MADDRLQGKVALVTGGGDGIGLGVASRFASAGAAVVIAEYDEAKGVAAAERLRSSGARSRFVACDVTDRTQMEAAVETAVEEFGSVDILVNNAYRGLPPKRIEQKTDDEYRYAFAINFFGPQWAMLRLQTQSSA